MGIYSRLLLRYGRTIIIIAAFLPIIAATSAHAIKVAVIKSSDIKPYSEALEGFRNSCDCDVSEIIPASQASPAIIEGIIKSAPDGILAVGSEAYRKVKSIKTVPVFYVMVMPSELMAPLPHNTYGVSMEMSPKASLAAIREVFPKTEKIGLLFNPAKSRHYAFEISELAKNLGIDILMLEVSEANQIPLLLNKAGNRIDLLWMTPDATFISPDVFDRLLSFSFENKVPIFTFSRKYVEKGAVASLDINPHEVGLQAGEIFRTAANKVPKGGGKTYARGGSLIINSKIARKMGIKIKNEVIRKADDVD